MDAQVISIATAVVSAAVAALGLLLTWYRREDERQNSWPFIGAGFAIVALAVMGVTFTLILGARTESAAGTAESDRVAQLTASQYRGQFGAACFEASERGRQIEELRARETAFEVAIQLERDELEEISRLSPPDELETIHADIISTWQRRLSMMESIYARLSQLEGNDLLAELGRADQLADELAESFELLELQECII